MAYTRLNCYFGCEEGGPLHHFPKPEVDAERFAVWKSTLDDVMKEKSDSYIYNQLRVCDKHFEHYYVLPSKRLTRNAVPTLHLNKVMSTTTRPTVSVEIYSEPSPAVETPPNINSMVQEIPVSSQVDVTPSTSADLRRLVADSSERTKNKIKKTTKTGPSSLSQLVKVIERLRQRVSKLTQKCKTQTKKIKAARNLSENKSFLKIIEDMPESLQTFMCMQLKAKHKAKGRKFTMEEKVMAASIWKQSQKGYNFLRKLIVLPSKRTLQRLLSSISMKPGVNKRIFEHLKETVKDAPLEKRLYTLLFDEVALSPGLYFDNKEIIGFEDFGDRKLNNIADHALVLMIKGIKTKSKQPILYHFCKSTTKKTELKNILINTISLLEKAGIIIVATICDQATSNVSAIKVLQTETRVKYLKENKDYNSNAFEVGNLTIFPLFDTPHLLKGVRNNFMTKNVKYIQENKIKYAKWEHLRMLLNEDKGDDELRIINKLTEYHLDPVKLPKMKVKYAAQVFSQRVSAVMRFLAKRNILPAECEDTADFLIIFDKLFDSFNGHSYQDTAKVLKGCLKNNSKHIQFWDEAVQILKTIEFEKNIIGRDGTVTKIYEKVPSVQNWIHNIKTFKEMWTYLNKKLKIRNILTRNFNQDPLENFFCCIRSNGIRNVNPTCMQFINSYKTLLINKMNSPHSISANCEKDDFYQTLNSMKLLLLEKCNESNPLDFACEVDSLITSMNEIISSDSILHEETKKYVAGYIIKKCKSKIFKNCPDCKNDLLESEIDPDSFNYSIDYTKKSLLNACGDFVKLLNEIYFMIITCLRNTPEIKYIKDKMIFFINTRCDFSLITCNVHKSVLIDYIINLSINLIVHSWCTGVNRILIGKIINFDQNDSIKLQAFNYYKSHRKRK